VGVGGYYVVKAGYSPVFHNSVQQIRLGRVSAVYQHVLPAVFDKGRVGLPDVEKRHRQPAVNRRRGRLTPAAPGEEQYYQKYGHKSFQAVTPISLYHISHRYAIMHL
jgi:hypothetical protein